MSQPIALIFDLDGTLVDTAPDLLASLNAVLVKAGHRPVAPSELRHLVGHGVPAELDAAIMRGAREFFALPVGAHARAATAAAPY